MDDTNSSTALPEDQPDNPKHKNSGKPTSHSHPRFLIGFFLVVIGGLLLLKQAGILFPGWLFSWPSILIFIGLMVGSMSGFKGYNWLGMIAIGAFFLADRMNPEWNVGNYVLPGIVIIAGLVILSGSKRKGNKKKWERYNSQPDYRQEKTYTGNEDKEEKIDGVSFFGGTKHVVFSKNFKGGDIVNIFGGSEINLSQADIHGTVELEVVQIFGGTKLIVPSHWEVRSSEAVSIFGGIDDKREVQNAQKDKVLVIRGVTIFGGLDIKSY